MRRESVWRWRLWSFFLLSFSFLIPLSGRAAIVINEILAASSQEDESGVSLEWIELYNTGAEPTLLDGYTLTDDPLAPSKWRLPGIVLPAEGFLLIWATGYDLLDRDNYHANFRLRREGETIALHAPDGSLVDQLTFLDQKRDISYGRKPDGSASWVYFLESTPGRANTTEGTAGFTPPPVFSTPAGIYRDGFTLALNTSAPSAEIYYTLDGSPPDQSSERYQIPILIENSAPVRARVFQDGYFPSDIVTNTYIIREGMALPILSLVTDPDNLWDRRTGIYANPEQRGIEWERPVSVEFFTMDGERGFVENAGLRMHGGASRSRSPRKSFRLYFRSEYGAKKLEYPLFPTSPAKQYNQIVIRGGFNDTWTYDREMQRDTAIYVSDQTARNLHLDMGNLACYGLFTELYLNGEYWGLYNPTDRVEEEFLQEHFGFDSWDVISDGEVKNGSIQAWTELTVQLQRMNLHNPADYEELQTLVDLENYTDYIILNVWLQNYDWPHHNWYVACERHELGKWKYFLWDVEYSFGSGIQGYRVDQNTFDNAVNDTIGLLFRKLIETQTYKDYFWRRLQWNLQHTLSDDHVLMRLQEQLDQVRPAIPAEAERWANDKSLEDWDRAAQLAKDFIPQRTPIVLRYAEQLLGPPPVSVSDWKIHE